MTIVLAAVLSGLALLLIAALSLLLRRYVEERAEELAHARVSNALTAVNARVETVSRQVETAAEQAARRPPAASVVAAGEPFVGVLELDELFRLTLEAAARLGGVDATSIWLERVEEKPVVATLGLSPEEASQQAVTRPPNGREARSVSISYRHPPGEDGSPQLQTGIGVPLPLPENGFLTVFSRSRAHRFGEDDVRELESIVARAAPAIESARRRELRQLAEVDPLTQLGNRRSFEEDLAREIARARRYGRRLALVVLDLDGHLDSASALASVAGHVREAVRRTDASYRIGASEFALILPESSLGDAERLCRRLEHSLARSGANGRSLDAAGLAELARHDDEASLLRRAVAARGHGRP
jgi:GGDEF domain-containing protein